MEHEGKPLAADETDSHHHRPPGIATVHTRAVITWIAIFPLVAIGMTVIGAAAPDWPPVLRALVLTLVVVPTTVYLIVPRLLLLRATVVNARFRRRVRRMRATTPGLAD
jgi:antibiotic biosynthesis monooxygenase (ABM) superfamily enzyme